MVTKRNTLYSVITIGFMVLSLGFGQIIFTATEAHACDDIAKKIAKLAKQLKKASAAEEKAEKKLQKAIEARDKKAFEKADSKEKAADKKADKLEKKYAKLMKEFIACIKKKAKK